MITSFIRVTSKVRIKSGYCHGQIGFINDLKITLHDECVANVLVWVTLYNETTRKYDSIMFDLDEIERLDVGDVQAKALLSEVPA